MADTNAPSPSALLLGLGGCLDYEMAWDAEIFSALVREYGIAPAEIDAGSVIESERALVCSILAFMRDGDGGERVVADHAVIETFSARFSRRVALGGTSVRAGIAMSKIGLASTLHLVSIDDQVRALLPDGIDYVCSAGADSINPHLIVQYPRGASVAVGDDTVVAPHPNRLIYVSDPPNREMVLAEDLGDALAKARLFLISGFNAMVDREALEVRMSQLRAAMNRLSRDALVVFEDAGYHVPSFNRVVIDALLYRIDVYGMNEDELQSHIGRRINLLDPVDVAQALREVAARVPAPILVVHTKYWALAYGEHARSMRDKLEGGVAMASARFLYGDALDADRHASIAGVPSQAAGRDFAARIEAALGGEVCCVPGRELDTETPTTIGLGDAFVGGIVAALARRADAATPAAP